MNGITHTYEVVIAPGITWNQARAAAIAKKGHLATITSKAENDLVFSHIQNTSYWSVCRGNMFGPWLGGWQPLGSQTSSTGWAWVTGEKWEYTNWSPEEPNDFLGGEDKLFFYVNTCTPSSTWGDHRDDGDGVTAYIIEWEKPVISPLMVFSQATHWKYAEKVPK
ncbi:lectin-like protein [uncultured Methanospirillum sp.]|uniref:lectin-like protein n=1 Tax=uncultured Methanospirillum sp. TaxID=262503 RepID=UPI0029C6F1E0|nr:lectin-like protein [uncultured Methanospirillum sp.]